MNVPDFDKTSALIKSSAERVNSMSVVGVSPVLIVMGGGPVDGIGTSIYICVIFAALAFRSLYFNSFDTLFQFCCFAAFLTLLFTKIVFNFSTRWWIWAWVCVNEWVCVCMYRRFMCYVLRATQNFHENLSHLCIIALFILPDTHTFCSQQMKSHHRSIYNNCLFWLYWFETQLQSLPCNSTDLGYTQPNSQFTFFNLHKQLYWPKIEHQLNLNSIELNVKRRRMNRK